MIFAALRVTLGSLWGYVGGTLEPYLRQFDVEKHEMASVRGRKAKMLKKSNGFIAIL